MLTSSLVFRAYKATIYATHEPGNEWGDKSSCGPPIDDEVNSVALSYVLMGGESMEDAHASGLCGRKIRIENLGKIHPGQSMGRIGTTIEAVVRDTCPSCEENHLDLSEAAWNELTDHSSWSEVWIDW
jgi:hypothetical protein